MNIINKKINEIKPYGKNPRKNNEAVPYVANSIKEFGFKVPIVIDKMGVIVCGHTRYKAAKSLNMEEVPCVIADDLNEEQIKAFRLVDNKVAEKAEWDFDLLGEELEDLANFDMGDFGFDLDLDSNKEKEVEEDNFELEIPTIPNSKRGDIYQLGNHRLMCGDSTCLSDVNKLLDNQLCDLVVTDPPYNMKYEGGGGTKDKKSKRILNDSMPEPEFAKFITKAFRCCFDSMKDGATIYSFYKEMGWGTFLTSFKDANLTYKQELIWVKNHFVIGGAKYQSIYEPFLLGCKGKSIKIWNGGRKQASVIESIDFMKEEELRNTIKQLLDDKDCDILREKKILVADLHPTMKPVRLIARLIQNSSNDGDVVLDLFGGSGTTMIACEQIGRSARLMELDERFVDVIIKRWEDFTGEKAKLIFRNGQKIEE